MLVSVVIPVYNGAATIGPLVRRLIELFNNQGLQVVLVNDGSPDESHAVCRTLQAKYGGTITYLRLARNFGEHNAVMAGLHHARGDYVVVMDDDLQNPPEEVARLIDHARAHDHDLVYSSYARKQHHWLRNLGSRFNDAVACLLLNKPRGLYLSSFKCLSRFAVGEMIKYAGPYPYIDGLALRCTRHIGTIEVRHEARKNGCSNYTPRKLVRLWMNMFISFSVMPLRASLVMGLAFSFIGFLLGVGVCLEKLWNPILPVGWTFGIVTIVLFSGVQLVMLGLIGEYLGRLLLTCNQAPQFVVREVHEGAEARPGRAGNRLTTLLAETPANGIRIMSDA